MSTDHFTIPLKTCTKCGEQKPVTPEYFGRDKSLKDGFKQWCKPCMNQMQKEWRNKNRDHYNQWARDHYKNDRERIRNVQNAYYAKTAETRREQARGYRRNNAEEISIRDRDRYQRDSAKNNNSKYKAMFARREARKANLPNTFTTEDWHKALDYFNGCCAVCGRPLRDLFGTHTAAADHFIPLSSPECPGTVPNNILPLCHSMKSGGYGCNSRKHTQDPIKWITKQFGKKRAKKILARIYAYFDSLKLPT